MLSYVALFVIFLLLVLVAAAMVALGSLPGKIAERRGHPWPDAVNAASWIGLATGVFWPLAFIWAYLPVPQRSQQAATEASTTTADLQRRVAALEATIEKLQSEEGAA